MFRIEDFEEVLEGIPETIQDPITGNQYNREKFLGKGASGKCYLFTDLETRKKYAGKIIMMNTLFNELDMIHNETSIQKSLRHQNIIRMFGHFDCSRYTCMILELCDGTLEDVLERLNFLDEPSCRFVVREVARGISYLHEKQIIHRDIKPDNIFLTKDMDVKIGDFGIAIRHEDPTEKIMESCGTRIYLSPESLNRYGYSFGVDVWALGVTLYKMIVGYVSFYDWFTSVFNEITKIRNTYIAVPSKVPLHTRDMIKILLTPVPDRRPTIDDVLKCDYVNSNSISKGHLHGYISGKPISYDINQKDFHKCDEMSLNKTEIFRK